jgi:hypothetical protein
LSQVTSAINYDSSSETLRATVFTQTDPTPNGAGHPFESAYAYAGNNPAVYVDPSGLRKTCKAPGVATTFKLFGKALVDKLPFVSSNFSECQARQGGAIAGVYEEDVVPVAKVVAVGAATVVTGGLAGTAVVGAGGGLVLAGCTAGAAGSFVPAAMANSGADAAKTIAGGTAIGCATGGLGKVISVVRSAGGEASIAFRSDTSHIFRSAVGHLVEDTAANRALIQSAVRPGNLVAERSLGSSVLRSYQKLLPDGSQVWAEVRDGAEITNGGVNSVPR